MINYTKITDWDMPLLPGKFFQYTIAIEMSAVQLQSGNFDRAIETLRQRICYKVPVEVGTLTIEKVFGTPENIEFFVTFKLASQDGTVYQVAEKIKSAGSALGKTTVSNIAREISPPINLGQPELGLIEQVKKFLDSWGVAVEILLLIFIVILLLTSDKQ